VNLRISLLELELWEPIQSQYSKTATDITGVHKFTLSEGVGAGYGKTTTISLFQTN